MAKDEVIRELARQSVRGLEPESTAVLADALLETDRPDLGEDLALVLSDRRPFPREQRGKPFTLLGRTLAAQLDRADRERALAIIFRRIRRRFAWTREDEQDQRSALRELRQIATNWSESYARGDEDRERDADIRAAVQWLEDDNTADEILYERASWLLSGHFGRGAQLLAEEIIDAPTSRQNREAQLFRLVLAFGDNLPLTATNRVWERLSLPAKRHATAVMQRILLEHGGEAFVPPSQPKRSRKR